jgi:hypothetical protein
MTAMVIAGTPQARRPSRLREHGHSQRQAAGYTRFVGYRSASHSDHERVAGFVPHVRGRVAGVLLSYLVAAAMVVDLADIRAASGRQVRPLTLTSWQFQSYKPSHNRRGHD